MSPARRHRSTPSTRTLMYLLVPVVLPFVLAGSALLLQVLESRLYRSASAEVPDTGASAVVPAGPGPWPRPAAAAPGLLAGPQQASA